MKPSEKLAINIMAAAAQNLDPAIMPRCCHQKKMPRMIAIRVLRYLCPQIGFARIANCFGVHHSTAIHANQRIAQFCKKSPQFASGIDNLTGAMLQIHGEIIDKINGHSHLNYGSKYHGQPI